MQEIRSSRHDARHKTKISRIKMKMTIIRSPVRENNTTIGYRQVVVVQWHHRHEFPRPNYRPRQSQKTYL